MQGDCRADGILDDAVDEVVVVVDEVDVVVVVIT